MLADDLRNSKVKRISIIRLALIETKRLFIEIAKTDETVQPKYVPLRPRFKSDQKFNPICVNVAFDVLLSMVDYAVNVIAVEIVVRLERVAKDHRFRFQCGY